MKEIKKLLESKSNYLSGIVEKLSGSLKGAPAGRLEIDYCKKNPQFYLRPDEHSPKRQYINNTDTSFISSLAQKEYDRKILHLAERQLSQIQKMLKLYDERELSSIYTRLSPLRKQFVDPIVPDDEEYARRWASVECPPGYFEENEPEIYTEKNERVRSKSEKILADKFSLLNIPYRYEFPITFPNRQVKRPDFLLLNVRTKKEFYWEHAGRMHDPGYVDRFIKKMTLYNCNGIIPGINLILTFESSNIPLNFRAVDALIGKFLL